MTHSLDYAISLNNEGVSHVVSNNDVQAVHCFSKALCIIKKLIPEDEAEDELPPSHAVLHAGAYPLPQFKEDDYFLCNNVISFKRCELSTSSDSHIYCASIILNLAIVYHRQAILGGPADAISKAEKFYDVVTKIVTNKSDNRGTGLLINLAAVNNLSHIRLEKGDRQGSEEGLQTLAWLVVTSTDDDKTSLFNFQEIEGMLLNVLMANRQTVSPAA
jgi:hypothetical protein